jgi:hypothetical protein
LKLKFFDVFDKNILTMSDKIINKRWYAYVHGNPLSPKSYFLINIEPGFNKGTQIAAIFAKGYAEYPDEFSPKMKTHIANAYYEESSCIMYHANG